MKDQTIYRRQLPQLVVKVNCESCNGTFSYTQPLANLSGQVRRTAQGEVVEVSPRSFPPDSMLSVKRCPGCGYYQSWMVQRVRRNRQATALLLVLAFFFLIIPGTIWFGSSYQTWLGSENATLEAVMGIAFIGAVITFPVSVGVILWSRRSAFWDPNRRFPNVSTKRPPSKDVLESIHPAELK